MRPDVKTGYDGEELARLEEPGESPPELVDNDVYSNDVAKDREKSREIETESARDEETDAYVQ